MDYDGFATVQGRRRAPGREIDQRRNRQTFLQEVSKYPGTPEEYTATHRQVYGHDERLPADGSHPRGMRHFPKGSERETLWKSYHQSTAARDNSRNVYRAQEALANEEYDSMDPDEQTYYDENTGCLPPHQHAALYPRAKQFAEKSYNNASGRDQFLRTYPIGYHSRGDQHRHYDDVEEAYAEHEYAAYGEQQHDRYRSLPQDPRRDKYGRSVPFRMP